MAFSIIFLIFANMVVYKAYHEKHGWSSDYKLDGNIIKFNFGFGYVDKWDNNRNRICVGFEILNDAYYKNDKVLKRENAIDKILDEDKSIIYTDHYYIYQGKFSADYYTIDNPLFVIKYEDGIFYYSLKHNGVTEKYPLSVINDYDNTFIEPESLEAVGNIYDDWSKIKKIVEEKWT